jgi:hypothetical protein
MVTKRTSVSGHSCFVAWAAARPSISGMRTSMRRGSLQGAAKPYSLAAVPGLVHAPDTRLPLEHAAQPLRTSAWSSAIRSRTSLRPRHLRSAPAPRRKTRELEHRDQRHRGSRQPIYTPGHASASTRPVKPPSKTGDMGPNSRFPRRGPLTIRTCRVGPFTGRRSPGQEVGCRASRRLRNRAA